MSSLYRATALVGLLLSSLACRASAPRSEPAPLLSYEIRAPRADDPCVRVTLRTHATAEGLATLSRSSDWGGTHDTEGDLVELAATGEDGRPLELEASSGHRFVVHARPAEAITVVWGVPKLDRLQSAQHNDHYRPSFDGELFHAIGNLFLFAPEELASDSAVPIGLAWKGFDELGWTTVSSFGTARELVVERPLDAFRHAVFLAGKLRLVERPIRGQRLAVALPASGLDVDPEAFADLCAKIVEGQRAFFDDWDYPFYLISAVATGKEDPRSSMLGGTGLTDSFALFLQRGGDLHPGSALYPNVLHVLAHEMFHNWCGRATPIAEPERQCYWFSEGFTDFFTRRLLLRTGLTDRAGYAQSLEKSLHDYHHNPRRNCTNQEIADGFWKDRATGDVPYRRGDLVAALLDGAIRAKSAGAKSLDDFLREAVALGRQGQKLDVEVLLARIERWTDAACAARVRAIVVDGATVELPRDLFAPCLAIEPGLVPAYDVGFDTTASISAKRITGLKPESAAARAGLSEGQKLMGFSAEQRADRPVRVDVLVDGQRRSFEYLPQGAAESLPLVRLDPSADCAVL